MEEANLKIKLLESIGNVYERSKKCRLQAGFFGEIDTDLELLSDYFGISKTQAFFVAVVMAMNYRDNTVDYKDLSEYFRCNPMEILYYSDDFAGLCNWGIFRKEKSLHRPQLAFANDQFSVCEEVTDAILQNKPMPDIAGRKMKEVTEVLGKLFSLSEQRNREMIPTFELFFQTQLLFHNNMHFPLINKVAEFRFDTADNYLFLYMVWKTVAGEDQHRYCQGNGCHL
jgi:hypothetical protein